MCETHPPADASGRARGEQRWVGREPQIQQLEERAGYVRRIERTSERFDRRIPRRGCGLTELERLARRRERRDVYLTNLALAVLIGGLGLVLGYGRVAAVQLPIMVIASIVGVWLFSIQHRFEHAQWMPDASWSFAAASLGGTSHLHLPGVLQWFTGNIGFHHVHHINPRIPNYRLEECHNADAGFQSAPTLTLRSALQAMRYVLWDSDLERLVPFRFAAAGRVAKSSRAMTD